MLREPIRMLKPVLIYGKKAYRGLCSTCDNAATCTFPRDPALPVMQCDEFQGETISPEVTLSIVEMDPHAVIPEHSHLHEQIGYMVEGQFEFIIGGRSHQVGPGQIWRIPGRVPPKVIAGDRPGRAGDGFSPVRAEMRE